MSKLFFASPEDWHECPGCEEQCIMPVVVRSLDGKTPFLARIYCDKNEDFGPVKVELSDIPKLLEGLQFEESKL